MLAELLVLRLVHILGGIFWVGGMMYSTFFLVPVVRSSPAVAGTVMAGLQKRRLFVVLPTVALLTIASGSRLFMIDSGGFSDAYFASNVGRAYEVGGIAAIVAFLISMFVSRPAFVHAVKLGASLSTTTDEPGRQRILAEVQRLNQRAGIANTIVVVLLLLTAVTMATARYL
jgi:uncharacterized membrane protein